MSVPPNKPSHGRDPVEDQRARESKERKRQQHEDNVQIVTALNRVADELVATEKQSKSAENSKAKREYLTIALVFATVVATIFAALEAHRLADLTRDALRDARRVASITHRDNINALKGAKQTDLGHQAETAAALKIAQDNATTAKGQLSTAQQTAQKQLRAYVGRESHTFMWVEQTEQFQIQIRFRNHGVTPAYNTIDRGDIRIMSADEFQHFNFVADMTGYTISHSATLLDPGVVTTITLNSSRNYSKPEVEAYIRSRLNSRLIAYGTIEYRDIFGNPHHTNYCYDVLPLATSEANKVDLHAADCESA